MIFRESAEREKYPVSVRAHSPGIRSPARKHTPSRPNSSSRPLTPARLRTRSRTPRGYRSPKLDLSPPYRRDASRDYSPAGRASAARSQAREVSPRVQGGRDYCRDRSPRGRSYSRDRSPRPRDYSRDCSPRAREYSRDGSPRDYDKNSHHSSGSRRHHSPRKISNISIYLFDGGRELKKFEIGFFPLFCKVFFWGKNHKLVMKWQVFYPFSYNMPKSLFSPIYI